MEVLEDSEAERIGLEKDDHHYPLCGQEITNPSQIKTILNEMQEEGMVEIVVMRAAERKLSRLNLSRKKQKSFSGYRIGFAGLFRTGRSAC